MRGSVDKRVDAIQAGEFDGAVLAFAGLQRLGLERAITQALALHEMLPAAGQAVLVAECRRDDAKTTRALARWNDGNTAEIAEIETELARKLRAFPRVSESAVVVSSLDRPAPTVATAVIAVRVFSETGLLAEIDTEVSLGQGTHSAVRQVLAKLRNELESPTGDDTDGFAADATRETVGP